MKTWAKRLIYRKPKSIPRWMGRRGRSGKPIIFLVTMNYINALKLDEKEKKLFMDCLNKGPKIVAQKQNMDFSELKDFYDKTMEEVKRMQMPKNKEK